MSVHATNNHCGKCNSCTSKVVSRISTFLPTAREGNVFTPVFLFTGGGGADSPSREYKVTIGNSAIGWERSCDCSLIGWYSDPIFSLPPLSRPPRCWHLVVATAAVGKHLLECILGLKYFQLTLILATKILQYWWCFVCACAEMKRWLSVS